MTKKEAREAAAKLAAQQEAAAEKLRAGAIASAMHRQGERANGIFNSEMPKYNIGQEEIEVLALGCKVQVSIWRAYWGDETFGAMDRDAAMRWLAAKRKTWKQSEAGLIKRMMVVARLNNLADRLVDSYNEIEQMASLFPKTKGAEDLEAAIRKLEDAIVDIATITPDKIE